MSTLHKELSTQTRTQRLCPSFTDPAFGPEVPALVCRVHYILASQGPFLERLTDCWSLCSPQSRCQLKAWGASGLLGRCSQEAGMNEQGG